MHNDIPLMIPASTENRTVLNTYGDPLSVAGRTKSRRDLLSISPAIVAKNLGISIPEYSKLEQRFDSVHQTLYLEQLAKILRTTREWLENGDQNRLTLVPNIGDFIQCDQLGIPCIDTSPYTENELAQLPFCKEYKNILKTLVKSVGMPFSEYFWYADDYFLIYAGMTDKVLEDLRQHTGHPGWENMKVADQCAMFKLPLLQLSASEFASKTFAKKPYGKSQGITVEQFALDVFRDQGWEGYFDEGKLMQLIGEISMRALRLTDELWFEDQCALRGISPEEGSISFGDSEVVYPKCLNASHRVTVSDAFDALTLPRVSQLLRAIPCLPKNESDQAVIFKAVKLIDIEIVFKLLDLMLAGAHYGSGWPDLVLMRDGQFRFVEVKAKRDVLRKNQALLLRMVYKPLGLPFEVLHLVD